MPPSMHLGRHGRDLDSCFREPTLNKRHHQIDECLALPPHLIIGMRDARPMRAATTSARVLVRRMAHSPKPRASSPFEQADPQRTLYVNHIFTKTN